MGVGVKRGGRADRLKKIFFLQETEVVLAKNRKRFCEFLHMILGNAWLIRWKFCSVI